MKIVLEILKPKLPVIIFGAGNAGKHVLDFCIKNHILVDCFCDNNSDKILNKFCGVNVLSLSQIKEIHKYDMFLISVIDIQDIVLQLKKNNFLNWGSCNEILKDVYHPMISNMVLNHDNYLNKNKVYIRGIDVIITEKCSLKCKNCSNLMSYYRSPKNYNTDYLNFQIENFCSKVDKIGEVRIIGGEPFMNKDIHLIIQPLLLNSKINSIVIYTNATILPNENQLKVINHSKVSFFISDYGKLSKKFNSLCSLLDKENISYMKAPIKWTNCAEIKKNNRTEKQNQQIFESCCVKNLFTLLNNKLYRCPFFANADNLNAIPDFKKDYLELTNKVSGTDIKNYIMKKDYLQVCDFCNGRSFDDKEIESATQIKKSLEYKKYKR